MPNGRGESLNIELSDHQIRISHAFYTSISQQQSVVFTFLQLAHPCIDIAADVLCFKVGDVFSEKRHAPERPGTNYKLTTKVVKIHLFAKGKHNIAGIFPLQDRAELKTFG